MTPLQRNVLIMVLLNAFSTPLMLSSVNVALPAAARELEMSARALGWVPMAYLMASAMLVIIFGRLADLFGRKRIFLLGSLAVIISSVLTAFAPNTPLLLGGRFLQGASAAMLYATQVALVASVFQGPRRGRSIGMTVSAVYAGLACGPLLGGLAIESFGWRSAFLLHIPLGLVVLILGWRIREDWSTPEPATFDRIGAALYAAAILLFCLGVSRLPRVDAVALLAVSALAIVVFIRHALHTANPLWQLRLFSRNRVFAYSCGAALLMYSATYANVVLVSLYLQYLRGMSAGSAGLVMMVQPLCMALLSPLTGRLSERLEPRLLASLGMGCTTLGLVSLALLGPESPLSVVVLALMLTGIGFSLFSSPNVNAIMGAAPPGDYGAASGIVATTRILGQLSSMILVTLALGLILGNADIRPQTYPQLEQAITLSFSIAATLCVAGLVLSMLRGRIHTQTTGDST